MMNNISVNPLSLLMSRYSDAEAEHYIIVNLCIVTVLFVKKFIKFSLSFSIHGCQALSESFVCETAVKKNLVHCEKHNLKYYNISNFSNT